MTAQVRHKSNIFVLICCALFLSFLSGTAHAVEGKASGKNWKVSFEAFYIYDNNIREAPDNAAVDPAPGVDKGGSIFNWSGQASYIHRVNQTFDFTLDYDIDMTVHADSDHDAFDLTTHMIGLNPVYRFNKLFNLSLRNWFAYNAVDGDEFSTAYIFNPALNYMHSKFGMSRLHFLYKQTNHLVNEARDTEKHAIGFDQVFFFSDYNHYIGAGYQYAVEESQGLAFQRDMHNFTALAKIGLPFGLSLHGQYKFSMKNYFYRADSSLLDFRDDDKHDARVRLDWLLLKDMGFLHEFTTRVEYKHVSNISDLMLRDYGSDRVMIGAEAKF